MFYPDLTLTNLFGASPNNLSQPGNYTQSPGFNQSQLNPPPDRPQEPNSPQPAQVSSPQTHSLSQPMEQRSDPARHHIHVAPFLRVSQKDWDWLSAEVSRFSSVLPTSYKLPSRHALSRYLHGFMNGFHPHFPIIHPQSLCLREMAPELTLAIAAVGSQYCLESHQAVKIFPLARAIAMEKIRVREDAKDCGAYLSPDRVGYPSSIPNPEVSYRQNGAPESGLSFKQDEHGLVETMQALFFLMAMATWAGHYRSFVRQAIATQSVLAMLVRQHGLVESHMTPTSWKDWARAESARRTKLIIFCFFDLHTITFDLPSPLLVTDIHLRLPCREVEWRASDSSAWETIHQESQMPPLFKDCLRLLLTQREVSAMPVCSSLGGHILIHALLQHIFTIRQFIRMGSSENTILPTASRCLRQALEKWQKGWELNPESALSPLDKHGPIAFNSTVGWTFILHRLPFNQILLTKNYMKALFHLAFVRLAEDIGPERTLLDQDHFQVAEKLMGREGLCRSSELLLAARHAVCSMPPNTITIRRFPCTCSRPHLPLAFMWDCD